MAADNQLTIVIRARDTATRVLSRIRGTVARLNKGVLGGLRKLKGAILSFKTLIVGALAGAAVKVFTSFETGLAQVSTLVDTNKVNMKQLGDGIKQLASDSGESFASLNAGLFDTISAGVDAADAMEFLGTATKLAIGGGTSTDQAIKGVVSLMNAYGLEASDAAEISDSLFAAMQGGITTIGQLSSNVGKVAPVARKAGLSMDEMNAAIAALTKGGLSTEEAVTALKGTLQSLIKPTDLSIKAAEDLGIKWDAQALSSMGLLGVLKQLSRDGIKPTVEQQAALTGSSTAFVGVSALAADGAKNFTGILETMANKTGKSDEAFGKMNETLERKLLQAWQTVKVAIVEVVNVFADDLKVATDNFKNFIKNNTGNIERFAKVVRAAFKLAGAVIANFFSKDGNNAQAAIQFWSTTMIAIWTFGLKTLVGVVVLGGKTLGRALLLALGDAVREGLNELARDIVTWATGIPGFLVDFEIFSASDVDIATDALDDIAAAAKKVKDDAEFAFAAILEGMHEMKKGASPEVVKAINEMEVAMTAFRDRWGETAGNIDKVKKKAKEVAEAVIPAASKDGSTGGGVGAGAGTGGAAAVVEATIEQIQALLTVNRLVELSRLTGVQRSVAEIKFFYDDELARFKEMLDAKLISEGDFQRARTALLTEQQKEIVSVTAKEASETTKLWTEISEQVQGILSANISDFFTSVIEGTKTVGQAFADMVTSILQEIGRLLVQKAVSNIISTAFGVTAAAKGAVWSGGFNPVGSLPRFAKGGVANGPTIGIIGDNPSRREAMVPLPDGRNIPVKLEGDGGGGGQDVTVNFTFNSLDPRTGAEVIRGQKEVIKGIVVEALNADPNFIGRARERIGGRR